jgi:hypothetical protein
VDRSEIVNYAKRHGTWTFSLIPGIEWVEACALTLGGELYWYHITTPHCPDCGDDSCESNDLDIKDAILSIIAQDLTASYSVDDMYNELDNICFRGEDYDWLIKSHQTRRIRAALVSLERAGVLGTCYKPGLRRSEVKAWEYKHAYTMISAGW